MSEVIREGPAVALRGMTILPGMVAHFDVSRPKSIKAVENAMLADQRIFLVAQRDVEEEEPDQNGLYKIGVIATVKQVIKMPHEVGRVLVEGKERAELIGFLGQQDYLLAEVAIFETEGQTLPAPEIMEAMVRGIHETIAGYGAVTQKAGKELAKQAMEITDLDRLVDYIGNNIPISYEYKQRILEAVDLEERYDTVMTILMNEINVIRIKNELQAKVKEKVDKNQKEYILREQMKLIREELGEDNIQSEADQFLEEEKKLKADKAVKDKLKKEIEHYKSL